MCLGLFILVNTCFPPLSNTKEPICHVPACQGKDKTGLSDRTSLLLVNSTSYIYGKSHKKAFRRFFRNSFARSRGAEVDKQLHILKGKKKLPDAIQILDFIV